jgi:hypothetical protein
MIVTREERGTPYFCGVFLEKVKRIITSNQRKIKRKVYLQQTNKAMETLCRTGAGNSAIISSSMRRYNAVDRE